MYWKPVLVPFYYNLDYGTKKREIIVKKLNDLKIHVVSFLLLRLANMFLCVTF